MHTIFFSEHKCYFTLCTFGNFQHYMLDYVRIRCWIASSKNYATKARRCLVKMCNEKWLMFHCLENKPAIFGTWYNNIFQKAGLSLSTWYHILWTEIKQKYQVWDGITSVTVTYRHKATLSNVKDDLPCLLSPSQIFISFIYLV